MTSIHTLKEAETPATPLLLFECQLSDGSVERWSTHRIRIGLDTYEPRLLSHGGFEIALMADDNLTGGGRLHLTLSNVDGRISQIERSAGFRGAKVTARLGMFDLVTGLAAADSQVVFLGTANAVEILAESTARISLNNRLSLTRLSTPGLRVQAGCPWRFPATADERQEAVSGGATGTLSPFYRCGYSPDMAGGTGNLNSGVPFTSCGFTREDCVARGMFDIDTANRETRRFGGFGFLPPSTLVRPHGSKAWVQRDAVDGRAASNDAVPLVYGTCWTKAPVIFAKSDGNLTHCEVLLSSGPIEGVLRVIANGVELPPGEAGKDMTSTGWYNVASLGERNGAFNADFTANDGTPLGDPHGSMAVLSVVVPESLARAGSLPRVEVLLNGLKLARYSIDGLPLGAVFTRNPSWVILDLLRRAGWREEELDLAGFAAAAAQCDQLLDGGTGGAAPARIPTYEVSLAITERHSLHEIVRGIRTASGLMLALNSQGRLTVRLASTLTSQQPDRRTGSNATSPLAGGWPAYEFGDGSDGTTGILRRDSGESSFRLTARAASETPTRYTAEYQDSLGSYQRQSLSMVDFAEVARQGVEIPAALPALGLPNAHQASRLLRLELRKSVRGNLFAEFETSLRAYGLQPGDLITITMAKEGLNRALFRVLRLSIGENFETARLLAQKHEDEWYDGTLGSPAGLSSADDIAAGRMQSLCGAVLAPDGIQDFEVQQAMLGASGESPALELTVRFTPPAAPSPLAPAPPTLSLTAEASSSGGTLEGGGTLYYAMSSVDASGNESKLSFVVAAKLPGGSSTCAVSLTGVRYPARAARIRVYRGATPLRLLRIVELSAPVESYTDKGEPWQLVPAPDPAFRQAAFSWRPEILPATVVTLVGATAIGNAGLALTPNEYRGASVRIVSGKGAGQERIIESHDATTLHVKGAWVVLPDSSSSFVIAEAGWRPGGVTASDSVRFPVPFRPLTTVHVTGVPVDAVGDEGSLESAIVTRAEIAAGGGEFDSGVPPKPVFGVSTTGQGDLEVGGIGFETPENTRSITNGSLAVHYWNELDSPTTASLGEALTATATAVLLAGGGSPAVAKLLQVGQELLRVLGAPGADGRIPVDRGVHGTPIESRAAGTPVFVLERRTSILSFPRGFFGSPASGSYYYRFPLPSARVAAAELSVTNQWGTGPAAAADFTTLADGGLRTLSGGQYTLMAEGDLAVESQVTPPLTVGAATAVRDVLAALGREPLGAPVIVRLLVNGSTYCDLTIPAGGRRAAPFSGVNRAPLAEGSVLTVDVLSVGTAPGTYPGRDLSVVVRT